MSLLIDDVFKSDASRPRIVKRGIDEIVEKVEPDEIDHIDHLCFVIHGIGEGCDLKFRPIVDCGLFIFMHRLFFIRVTLVFKINHSS